MNSFAIYSASFAEMRPLLHTCAAIEDQSAQLGLGVAEAYNRIISSTSPRDITRRLLLDWSVAEPFDSESIYFSDLARFDIPPTSPLSEGVEEGDDFSATSGDERFLKVVSRQRTEQHT